MTEKDPQLDRLYQDGDKQQPPAALDAAILTKAKQDKATRLSRLRPWLAAASVLLTVPILWLLIQQPELQQAQQESFQPEPVPSAPVVEDNIKADDQLRSNTSADDIDPQDKLAEHGKITVTGSRIKRRDSESDTAGLKPADTAEKAQAAAIESQSEDRAFSELKAEQEAIAVDSMTSAPASYTPHTKKMQQTSETMAALIEQLKPDKLTETEQALWQELQKQVKNQQWFESQKTLQQLKQQHSSLDLTRLEDRLKHLSKQ